MAQFGRALRSGRRGRVFESRHSDLVNMVAGILELQGSMALSYGLSLYIEIYVGGFFTKKLDKYTRLLIYKCY